MTFKQIFMVLGTILILVSFSGLAAGAQSASVTQGWHYFIDNITHGSDTYTISGSEKLLEDEGEGSIKITKNNGSTVFVDKGECEETASYEYCFTNTSILHEKARLLKGGITLYPALEYSITTFSYESALDIRQDISPSDITIADVSTATITLENTGDYALSNIVVRQTIPSDVSLVQRDDVFSLDGRELIGRVRTLQPGQQRSIEYQLRGRREGEQMLQTNVYFDSTQQKGYETQTQATLSIQPVLSIACEPFLSPLELDEEYDMSCTITNNAKTPLELINMSVFSLQESLTFTTKETGLLEEVLEAQEQQRRNYTFTTTGLGNATIVYEGVVDVAGTQHTHRGEMPVEVNNEGLSCTLDCSGVNQHYNCSVELANKQGISFFNSTTILQAGQDTLIREHARISSGRKVGEEFLLTTSASNISSTTTYQTKYNDSLVCIDTYNVQEEETISQQEENKEEKIGFVDKIIAIIKNIFRKDK